MSISQGFLIPAPEQLVVAGEDPPVWLRAPPQPSWHLPLFEGVVGTPGQVPSPLDLAHSSKPEHSTNFLCSVITAASEKQKTSKNYPAICF